MNKKKVVAVFALIVILTAGAITAALLADRRAESRGETQTGAQNTTKQTDSEDVGGGTSYGGETTHRVEEPLVTVGEDGENELCVGEGLVITSLNAVSGKYVEDGGDSEVSHVVAATVMNSSVSTLQYAKFSVTDDGDSYTFELSTLPPGESVCVLEANKKTRSEAFSDSFSASVEHEVYFDTEPTSLDGELSIEVQNGAIKVTNISSATVTRDISVFFKNRENGMYFGGITYRARITDDLEPGESVSVYASHASVGESVIMFAQYDS